MFAAGQWERKISVHNERMVKLMNRSANSGRGTPIVGEFLPCRALSPAGAEKLVDNSGMSGLRAPNHLHDGRADNALLLSAPAPITFAFASPQPLGFLFVWNYSADGRVDCGLRDIRIEYSPDGEAWLPVGDFRLSRALPEETQKYGGNAANNQADGQRSPIDLGGIPALQVRITPLSNYGGSGWGLGEVRFFRDKTRPGAGQRITASVVAPLSGETAANLTNGRGLSDPDSVEATHGADARTMWMARAAEPQDALVVIDLDGTYPLRELAIWNYNAPEALDCGVQELLVEYTTDAPCSIKDGVLDYHGGKWQRLGVYTLPRANGEDGMAASLRVNLTGLRAQHLRLTPQSNYGGDGFGLSAVSLFAGTGWAAEPSREWEGMFSNEGSFPHQISGHNGRPGTGWILADGIYTLHINGRDEVGSAQEGSRTLFLFSDTLLGNFRNFDGEFGKYGVTMDRQRLVNHSLAFLYGNRPDPRNLQFYMHAGEDTENIFGKVDWAQELVRVGDKIHTWGMRFQGWAAEFYDAVTFDTREDGFPDLSKKPALIERTPIRERDGEQSFEFSACVLDNTVSGGATPDPDGYIYIFGLRTIAGIPAQKYAIVARVRPEQLTDNAQWRYWDGADWVADMKRCAPISAEGCISSEYSISYVPSGLYAGKYMLVYTRDTMMNQVQFATSDKLTGPYQDAQTVYFCDDGFSAFEANGDATVFTYNAKAHPHLSQPGELLITYNVNSMEFDKDLSHEFLHPHFLRYFEIN